MFQVTQSLEVMASHWTRVRSWFIHVHVDEAAQGRRSIETVIATIKIPENKERSLFLLLWPRRLKETEQSELKFDHHFGLQFGSPFGLPFWSQMRSPFWSQVWSPFWSPILITFLVSNVIQIWDQNVDLRPKWWSHLRPKWWSNLRPKWWLFWRSKLDSKNLKPKLQIKFDQKMIMWNQNNDYIWDPKWLFHLRLKMVIKLKTNMLITSLCSFFSIPFALFLSVCSVNSVPFTLWTEQNERNRVNGTQWKEQSERNRVKGTE